MRNHRGSSRQAIRFLAVIAGLMPAIALSAFGSMQQAYSVTVTRIFSGQSTTYVEFSSLPGCNNSGGYLSVSWAAANGGAIDEARTKQIVGTLLFAKATGTEMEVRYRQNTPSTGWDSCAIDAVFLE
jgi:hypothetical protein